MRTPYDPIIQLRKNKDYSSVNKDLIVSKTEYAIRIESEIFLINYTQFDIAYVVIILSGYTHNLVVNIKILFIVC